MGLENQVLEVNPEDAGIAATAGISASKFVLSAGAAAYKAYKIFKQGQKHALASEDVADFDAMRVAFEVSFIKNESGTKFTDELPFLWDEKSRENGKVLLTYEISRDIVINSYNETKSYETAYHFDFYQLSNIIRHSLIESLEHENGKLWFCRENDRHPYVLFAVEFIHWAKTELLNRDVKLSETIELLKARIEYIQKCLGIGRLIPRSKDDEKNEPNTSWAVSNITNSLENCIKNLEVVQNHRKFEEAISKLDNCMSAIVFHGLHSQFHMIACLPNTSYHPHQIVSDNPNGLMPHSNLRKARQTLIYKRIQLFLQETGTRTEIISFEDLPDGFYYIFEEKIKELDIVSSNSNGEINNHGFDKNVFNTEQIKQLLFEQREYLLITVKWLLVKGSLDSFKQLFYFKGEEWMFCGEKGKKLLTNVINLISEIRSELQSKSNTFLKEHYKEWGWSFNRSASDTQKYKSYSYFLESLNSIKKSFEEISEYTAIMTKEAARFENQKLKVKDVENRILNQLGQLYSLVDEGSEKFKNLCNEFHSGTDEMNPQKSRIEETATPYPCLSSTASANVKIAKVGALEARLKMALDIDNKIAILYDIKSCGELIDPSSALKFAKIREKILGHILSASLCIILSIRNEQFKLTYINSEEKSLKLLNGWTEVMSVDDKLDILKRSLRILCYCSENTTITTTEQDIQITIDKIELHDFDEEKILRKLNLNKPRVLKFLSEHYIVNLKNKYEVSTQERERLIEDIKKTCTDSAKQQAESERINYVEKTKERDQEAERLRNTIKTHEASIEDLNIQKIQVESDQIKLQKRTEELESLKKTDAVRQDNVDSKDNRMPVEKSFIKTIENMINFYDDPKKTNQNVFLLFWKRLCHLDDTGYFFTSSPLNSITRYHQDYRQEVLKLEKHNKRLLSAIDSLDKNKDNHSKTWIKDIVNDARLSVIAKEEKEALPIDIIRKKQTSTEGDLNKLQNSAKGYMAKKLNFAENSAWSSPIKDKLIEEYETFKEKDNPTKTTSFFDAIASCLLQTNNIDKQTDLYKLDDLLTDALNKYEKTGQNKNYWQQIIFGLTVLGASPVPWIDSNMSSPNEDPIMVLAKLSPILLSTINHRAKHLGDLVSSEGSIHQSLCKNITDIGIDLNKCSVNDESTWWYYFSFSWLNTEAKTERVKLWMLAIKLDYLLINDALTNKQEVNNTLSVPALPEAIKKTMDDFTEAFKRFKEVKAVGVKYILGKRGEADIAGLENTSNAIKCITNAISSRRKNFEDELLITSMALESRKRADDVMAAKAGEKAATEKAEVERAAKEQERAEKERERAEKEQERAAKEQERAEKEQERAAKEQERAAKEQERAEKEQERAAKEEASKSLISTTIEREYFSIDAIKNAENPQEKFNTLLKEWLPSLTKFKCLRTMSEERLLSLACDALSEYCQDPENKSTHAGLLIYLQDLPKATNCSTAKHGFFEPKPTANETKTATAEFIP